MHSSWGSTTLFQYYRKSLTVGTFGSIERVYILHFKKKVKCTLVQALSLCTGCTAHRGSRGIALFFHDHRTGAKNLAPTGIWSPDCSACSQSLYWLSYPAHTDFIALYKFLSKRRNKTFMITSRSIRLQHLLKFISQCAVISHYWPWLKSCNRILRHSNNPKTHT